MVLVCYILLHLLIRGNLKSAGNYDYEKTPECDRLILFQNFPEQSLLNFLCRSFVLNELWVAKYSKLTWVGYSLSKLYTELCINFLAG